MQVPAACDSGKEDSEHEGDGSVGADGLVAGAGGGGGGGAGGGGGCVEDEEDVVTDFFSMTPTPLPHTGGGECGCGGGVAKEAEWECGMGISGMEISGLALTEEPPRKEPPKVEEKKEEKTPKIINIDQEMLRRRIIWLAGTSLRVA